MLKLAESHILSLERYLAGWPIENDPSIFSWAKLGSNENCLGPSKAAIEAMSKSFSQVHLYPNAKRFMVIEKISAFLKEFAVKTNQIALGNGTSELIVNLVRSLLGPSEALLYCWPTFVMYPIAASAHNRVGIGIPVKPDMSYDLGLMIEKINDRTNHLVKLVFLANPNNPTGKYLNHQELRDLVEKIPKDVVLIIDEAYCEYVTNEDYPCGLIYALTRPRTLVLRTFSKIYGLAGLRLGYAIGDVDIIDLLCRIRDPFNVNSVVQSAALAALEDSDHVEKSIRHNSENMPLVAHALRNFGFNVCEGVGNFVMAQRTNEMPKIMEICNRLLAQGVIIRALNSFGLNEWVRISIGTKAENAQLFAGLEKVLATPVKSIAAN